MPGPGEQQEVGPQHRDPVERRGQHHDHPDARVGLDRPVDQQLGAMNPSVPGNPTLASPVSRKHTASAGEWS